MIISSVIRNVLVDVHPVEQDRSSKDSVIVENTHAYRENRRVLDETLINSLNQNLKNRNNREILKTVVVTCSDSVWRS